MQRPETMSDVARAFGIGRSRSAGGAEARPGPDETQDDEDPEEDLLGEEETIALEKAVEAGWRVLVV